MFFFDSKLNIFGFGLLFRQNKTSEDMAVGNYTRHFFSLFSDFYRKK